ncbi:MAG: hypothetical protein AB7K68_00485 [Bacteriovoracia bacterium]
MKALILAVTLVFTFTGPCFASGSSVRGGGDEVALEFHKSLSRAISELKERDQEIYRRISADRLLDLSREAKIVVVDNALEVKIKDLIQNSVAVNVPAKNLILINRSRWQAIADDRVKEAISLHEILSLQKLEQTGLYEISAKYLALQGLPQELLSSSLAVNRLQQILALEPADSPYAVLEKLFQEAREPLTLRDLAVLHSDPAFRCQSTYSFKMRSDSDQWSDPSELRAVLAGQLVVETKAPVPGRVSRGPLFPGSDPSPAAEDTRIFVGTTGNFGMNSNPTWKNWQDSSLKSDGRKIRQSLVDPDQRKKRTDEVRKNNGLLVIKTIEDTNNRNWFSMPFIAYTYCYRE